MEYFLPLADTNTVDATGCGNEFEWLADHVSLLCRNLRKYRLVISGYFWAIDWLINKLPLGTSQPTAVSTW